MSVSKKELSGKERMRIAMDLGIPDRVPVMCQLSIGHYFLYSGLKPLDIWFRADVLAEALVKMQRRYRFDGILVNLPGRDPNFEKHIERLEDKPDHNELRVHWKNGNFSKIPYDDNPHYFMGDGKRYFPTFDEVNPETLWYVEPWDMTDITYPFTWGFDKEARPFDDFFPPYHGDIIREVKKRVGDSVSVHAEVFSPFAQFLELLNYEHALMALLDDPGKSHACLQRLLLGTIDLANRNAKEGVDAILISSAFAGGGLISREQYEEFVLPYERQLIKEVKAKNNNITFYTHTCGAIGDRLDLMIQTGTNGIDTLDPPPLGTVDLEEALPQLKGKTFIKGNLDPVNTLLRGNEKMIEEAVRHRLKLAAPKGGYILSSACSVAPAVRPELMEHMTNVAEKYGKYE